MSDTLPATLAAQDLATYFSPKMPEAINKTIEDITKIVDAHEPDTSTTKGRDEIRSLAARVTRSKTLLDKAGAEAKDAAQKEVDRVNAMRRDLKDRLDALAKRARKPLTDWEAAEEERKERHHKAMHALKDLGNTRAPVDDGQIETIEVIISTLQGALDDVEAFDPSALEEFAADGEAIKVWAADKLKAQISGSKTVLAQRVEFLRAEKVRQEEAERAEAEAEAMRQKMAEMQAKIDAANAAAKAAEDARLKAEKDAAAAVEAERARIEREAKEAEAARVSKEAAKKAEEDAAKADEARREAAEREERETERAAAACRIEAMNGVKEVLEAGKGPPAARIVDAIIAGKIPHVEWVG